MTSDKLDYVYCALYDVIADLRAVTNRLENAARVIDGAQLGAIDRGEQLALFDIEKEVPQSETSSGS